MYGERVDLVLGSEDALPPENRNRVKQRLPWPDGAMKLAKPPVNVEKRTIQCSTALSAPYYPISAAQRISQCSIKMQRTV